MEKQKIEEKKKIIMFGIDLFVHFRMHTHTPILTYTHGQTQTLNDECLCTQISHYGWMYILWFFGSKYIQLTYVNSIQWKCLTTDSIN